MAVSQITRGYGARSALEDPSTALTARERQIMDLVCEGQSNKEVGRKLDLSEGTVKVHLHHIYQKLAIRNRTALTAFAAHYGDQSFLADSRGNSERSLAIAQINNCNGVIPLRPTETITPAGRKSRLAAKAPPVLK